MIPSSLFYSCSSCGLAVFFIAVAPPPARPAIDMEKQHTPLPGATVNLDMIKLRSSLDARDVDIGQVLETHATPEQERKVLWKLDL